MCLGARKFDTYCRFWIKMNESTMLGFNGAVLA